MAKGGKADQQAVNAARGARIAREGEQLGLFGPEGAAIEPAERRAGPGRPAGSGNKLKSKLGQLMAARGYRDPAEHLAMLAGLDRPDLHPLALAAALAEELGEDVAAVMREMRQAAGELLPYWHAKVTPDVTVHQTAVQVVMPGAAAPQAAHGPDQARDVTPQPGRIAPPPMPFQIKQNQGVSDAEPEGSDAHSRTDEAKR